LQIGSVQQRFEAETQGNFVEANDGHEAAYSKRLHINNPASETPVTNANAPGRLRNIVSERTALHPKRV
jgi:hypothetical protein